MKNWKILSITISITSVILSGFVTKSATAESLIISDNGSSSTSEAHSNVSQNANVNQSNSADVNSNVNVTSNTGNNSASDNTGGSTGIQTGDSNTNVNVSTVVNQNTATGGCCVNGATNGVIAGNGSGSSNGLTFTNSTNTNINSTNYANITNNITGHVNTGNNTADNNTGNVYIKTGSIYGSEKISNKFNTNNVTTGIGGNGNGEDLSLVVKGNGTDSTNTINYSNEKNLDIITTNIASVVNNSDWDLNTGNNTADNNVGNVDLKTGDIVFKSIISNEGNINDVKVTCCDKKTPPVNPPPPVTPPTKPGDNPKPGDNKPSDKGSDNPPSGNSHTDVLAAVTGKILPTTGLNLFFLALIGNIVMLFLGMYLRLRSGRSPGVVVAI